MSFEKCTPDYHVRRGTMTMEVHGRLQDALRRCRELQGDAVLQVRLCGCVFRAVPDRPKKNQPNWLPLRVASTSVRTHIRCDGCREGDAKRRLPRPIWEPHVGQPVRLGESYSTPFIVTRVTGVWIGLHPKLPQGDTHVGNLRPWQGYEP